MDQSNPVTNRLAAAGCSINTEWIGRTAVISVSGVLDMLTSPRLEAAIAAAIDKHPAAIVVNLADVDFLASAGMGVLVSARKQTAGGFAVVASGPATSRPLKMVGLADIVGLHPALDEALAALGE